MPFERFFYCSKNGEKEEHFTQAAIKIKTINHYKNKSSVTSISNEDIFLFYLRLHANKTENQADYMLRVAETMRYREADIQMRLIWSENVQKLNLFSARLNEFCYLCSR